MDGTQDGPGASAVGTGDKLIAHARLLLDPAEVGAPVPVACDAPLRRGVLDLCMQRFAHLDIMPYRELASKELADMLGALSHPHRLRIVLELQAGERSVSALQQVLGISHSAVSQHLSVLRAHRMTVERREGRQVFYHLTQPALARWLISGLELLATGSEHSEEIFKALRSARQAWSRR